MKKILLSLVFVTIIFSLTSFAQDLPKEIKELKDKIESINKDFIVEYDRFEQETTISSPARMLNSYEGVGFKSELKSSLDDIKSGKDIRFSMFAKEIGSDPVWGYSIGKVTFLIDGERLVKEVRPPKFILTFIYFSVDELEKISSAKSVDCKIGLYETGFAEELQKDFSDFIKVINLLKPNKKSIEKKK